MASRRRLAAPCTYNTRDGALRNRAAGHWVPGPAAEQPVTAAKNRWCAEFAAGCLPVACIHASAASQLPVGSGPARPHGEVGYWEAAGQNRVEFFCHFPALSSRLLSAPSLLPASSQPAASPPRLPAESMFRVPAAAVCPSDSQFQPGCLLSQCSDVHAE